MGLREEIREELEEQEREIKESPPDDDRDLHGIGWNMLHNSFKHKGLLKDD